MGGRGNVNMNIGPNRRQMTGQMTMTQLANALANLTGKPVTDMTELKGTYDVDLTWTPDDREQGMMGAKMAMAGAMPPAGGGEAHPATEASDSGPTIFGAVQEKLGLKLDPRKGPVEILVIDHAEKVPTEN